MAVLGLDEIVIDCGDPVALAGFWAEALGVEAVLRDPDWTYLDPGPGLAVRIAFQRVPETKVVKNRLHLDIGVDDIGTEAERLAGLGAARVGEVCEDSEGSFQVMADPEGNEFCLVRSPGQG